MKRFALIGTIFFSTLFLSAVCHAEYREGYLLVKFSNTGVSGAAQTARQATVNAAGGGTIEKMYSIVPGLGLVKLPDGVSASSARSAFVSTAGVLYAEPDYIYNIQLMPNDPDFSELWGMHNTGQTGGTPDADIDAPEAWDIITGGREGEEVIVAVIDTGVDYTHPDLAANMWVNMAELNGTPGVDDDGNGYIDDIYGYDFYFNDGDPMDDNGHGTHCAGTIGGVGNNGEGVAGVCWNVKIMALKFLGPTGGGSTADAISCIQYAVDMGAVVSNNSWAGYGYSQALYEAIAAAEAADHVLVAAAGNEYNDNDGAFSAYPASYDLDNIVSVLATDDSDEKAAFSNWGQTSVDIGAPGVDIYSTAPGGGYQSMSGTSMACPHVAGAAALVLSLNPTLDYTEVKQALMAGTDRLSNLESLSVSAGRLNLYNTILLAQGEDSLPPLPDPAQWLINVSATGLNMIAMEAALAIDKSGVEYYFDCIENDAYDSGWQASKVYVRSDYLPGTTYSFRARARDKSENQNATQWSAVASATTASSVDNLPPAPRTTLWKAKPRVRRVSLNEIGMEAVTSYDENGVEYYFDCVFSTDGVDPNDYDSGWQSSPVYYAYVSEVDGFEYAFTAYVRQAGTTDPMYQTKAAEVVKVGRSASSVIREVPSAAYRTIQDAIDAANHGDTVLVHPGVYREINIDFRGKAITVRSENPQDPAIVAATVIDCAEVHQIWAQETRRAFVFQNMEGRNSVLDGITIRNATAIDEASVLTTVGHVGDPDQGSRYFGANGLDGEDAYGGAILIGEFYQAYELHYDVVTEILMIDNIRTVKTPSSPTIRNCVFRNCSANGEYGDLTSNAPGVGSDTPGEHGTRGLNGGNAYGGAIYAVAGSNPLLSNCEFYNCQAVGGNGSNGSHGGNGGGHSDGVQNADGWRGGDGGDGGLGGCAWGGAIYFEPTCAAELYQVTVSNCFVQVGQPGQGGNGGNGSDAKGTGRGGHGGNGGLGGDLRSPDSSGGAVYFGDNSTVIIEDCVFEHCEVIATLTGDYSGGNGGNGGKAAGDGQPGGNGGHGGPAYFVPDKMFEIGGATATGGTGGNGGDGSNGGPRGNGGYGGYRNGLGGQPNGPSRVDTGIFPSNMYYMSYYWEDTANIENPPVDPNNHLYFGFPWEWEDTLMLDVEAHYEYFTDPNDPNSLLELDYIRLSYDEVVMADSPFSPYYSIVGTGIMVEPTINLVYDADPNSGNPTIPTGLEADYDNLVVTRGKSRVITALTPTNPAESNAGACAGANFYGQNCKVTLRNTSVLFNSSFANHGGGELYDKGCQVTFENCRYEGNGTIYETPVVSDYLLEGYGGAIFADQPKQLVYENCSFINNQAYAGGAVYCNFGPSDPNNLQKLDMAHCVFENNKANYHFMHSYGGAVYAGNSLQPYEENFFNELKAYRYNNTKDYLENVLLYPGITEFGTFIVSSYADEHGHVAFRELIATTLWDDEVEVDRLLNKMQMPRHEVDIADCNFIDNLAAYGAGLYIDASIVDVTGSEFETNTALGGAGGFIYACDLLAQNNLFAYNVGQEIVSLGGQSDLDAGTVQALASGPGLYVSNSDSYLINNHFAANETDGYCGALYINGLSLSEYPQSVFNNLFVENMAGLAGGALVAEGGTDVEVMNCTFVDNWVADAYGYGGAVMAHNAFMSMNNTILWDNLAALGPQISLGDPLEMYQEYDDYMYGTTVYVDYSNIQDGTSGIYLDETGLPWLEYGAGNIEDNPLTEEDESDPQFIQILDPNTPVDRTFYLSEVAAGQLSNSPCLNRGTPAISLYDPVLGSWRHESNPAAWLANRLGFAITTRTDHVIDGTPLNIGYHYDASAPVRNYTLIAGIRIADRLPYGEMTVVTTPLEAPILIDAETTTYQYTFKQGTVVQFMANPDEDYRVARWYGADDELIDELLIFDVENKVTMSGNRKVQVEFELEAPRNLYVPETFDTIEEALLAAKDGDRIVLAPRPDSPYLIQNPDGLDFGVDKHGNPKNLVITSTNPDDPHIVESTIIDCRGSRYLSKRAFLFTQGQDARSQVRGITIRNAFTAKIGASEFIPTGRWPWWRGAAYWYGGDPVDPWNEFDPNPDPLPPLRGWSGEDASGDSYGGAILCENGSSPTIYKCVFENCTVAGGIGGDGEKGLYPSGMPDITADLDSQSGGHSGYGSGDGFGGAIAIRCGKDPETGELIPSRPIIKQCKFINNMATGGWGGIPGDAGTSYNSGRYGWGGNDPAGLMDAYLYFGINLQAGYGEGDGHGGAIYVEAGCDPNIFDCVFENNIARPGQVSAGGAEANGDAYDQPFDAGTVGAWGLEWGDEDARIGRDGILLTNGTIAGGAIYLQQGANIRLDRCEFIGNEAFVVRTHDDSPVTTRGGAVHADPNTTLLIENSVFTENTAGAVYASSGIDLRIEDTDFINNMTAYPVVETAYGYFFDFIDLIDLTMPIAPQPTYELGGAVTIEVDPNLPVWIDNCQFLGNTSHAKGGAILSFGDVVLNNSILNGNTAGADGGAFYSYVDLEGIETHTTAASFYDCEFSGNSAEGLGGAAYMKNCFVTVDNSFFLQNTAYSGGGLRVSAGDLEMRESLFYGNQATGVIAGAHRTVTEEGFGGGLYISDTPFAIEHTRFENNKALGIISAGGGLSVTCSQTYYDRQWVRNCLFANNTSDNIGGGAALQVYVDAQFDNCTFANNKAYDEIGAGLGGGLFVDHLSKASLTNSIVSGNTGYGIYEQKDGTTKAYSEATYTLFYNNKGNDVFDSDTLSGHAGNSNVPGYGSAVNWIGDPKFVVGDLGGYYLDQAAPSPAINRGGSTAAAVGLNLFTTDPTGALLDSGTVDLGYHYNDPEGIPEYNLKTSMINEQKNPVTAGTITPNTGTYRCGAVVPLSANIQKDYFLLGWSGGTLNDNTQESTNTVLMTRNKDISVQVRLRRTLNMGGSFEYDTLGDAIDDAQDGDIILVAPGEYTAPSQYPSVLNRIHLDGKKITISGANPDDEAVVRGTVFREYRFFLSNMDKETIIEGITLDRSRMRLSYADITLRNCVFSNSQFAEATEVHTGDPEPGTDGFHQYPIHSGALRMYDSSPLVSNCIFENNSIRGADGENGYQGNNQHPNGGDGGWPGGAYGGAVYCGLSSNPEFVGCRFTGNAVFGGNGGNGADFVTVDNVDYYGGRGGGWVYDDVTEQFLQNLVLGGGWNGWTYESYGDKYTAYSQYAAFYGEYDLKTWARWFGWGDTYATWEQFMADYLNDPFDPLGDPYDQMLEPWRYSGLGGAVYCEFDSDATFTDCVFENNQSNGGLTGVGGAQSGNTIANTIPWPDRQLNMPTAGGAVFAAHDSDLTFTNCKFSNNVANTTTVPVPHTFQTSFGGAVAYEFNCRVTFNDCDVSQNTAAVGGGIYGFESGVTIADCNVYENEAYLGGGIYLDDKDKYAMVTRSLVHQNRALIPQAVGEGESLEQTGQGAGMFAHVQDLEVRDTIFVQNQAALSGGGLMLSGTVDDTAEIFNCLFAQNLAPRDGGGASVNWIGGEPSEASWSPNAMFTNCTFADNLSLGSAMGHVGTGGGLYCGYDSVVEVLDSIFFGNFANRGVQIALGSTERPSKLKIGYTNIKGFPSANAVYVAPGSGLDISNFFNYNSDLESDEAFQKLPGSLESDVSVNYYLYQQALNVSPWKDRGSRPAAEAGLTAGYTTSIYGDQDKGTVDLGYHYTMSRRSECGLIDEMLLLDGFIDLSDLAIFVDQWLNIDFCTENNQWCEGTDLNYDGNVDLEDMRSVSICWLEFDNEPPQPDPAEWFISPRAVPGTFNKIEMAAVVHHDEWWPDENIRYQFYYGSTPGEFIVFQVDQDKLENGGNGDGWLSYDELDLDSYDDEEETVIQIYATRTNNTDPNGYFYYVAAEDGSGNRTALSIVKENDVAVAPGSMTVIPQAQILPETPDEPYSTVINPGPDAQVAVRMEARAYNTFPGATTPPTGYEARYQFERRDPDGLTDRYAYSSNPVLERTDVTVGLTYEYRVRMAIFHAGDLIVEGPFSHAEEDDWLPVLILPIDDDAPYPITGVPGDPAAHAGRPDSLQTDNWYLIVQATQAIDPSGADVEYRFICSESSYSSGGGQDVGPAWRNADNVGLAATGTATEFYPGGLTYNGSPYQLPYVYMVSTGVIHRDEYVWWIYYRDRSMNKNASGSSIGWAEDGTTEPPLPDLE